MKLQTLSAGILGCLLTVAIVGCDKQDKQSSAPTAEDAKKTTENAATAVKAGTEKAAAEVKAVSEKVVTEVKQASAKAVEAVTKPAEVSSTTGAPAAGLIEKTKNFVAEKKYADALNTLKELKNIKLTPEQEKIVSDLKAQVEKLMGGDAGKAVGNLLGK